MHKDMRDIIAENVRYYRIKSGMKREELANKAHIVYACLMKIERGKTLPRLDTLDCLAQALDLQTAQLLVPHTEPSLELSGNQCLKKFIQFSEEEQRLAVQLIETAHNAAGRPKKEDPFPSSESTEFMA